MANNDEPTAANMRLFALTAAVASLLKYVPEAKAELMSIAESLEDAPPIPVSDGMLADMSQEIRALIAGKWK